MRKVGLLSSLLGLGLTTCAEPLGYSARDVAFLGEETIVIAERQGRNFVSTDSGRTWTSSQSRGPGKELFVGSGGRVWGYDSWVGIHEGSHASLWFSDDAGENWQKIELDPQVVLPKGFLGEAGEEPWLVGFDGQVWRHASGTPEDWSRWTRVGVANPEGRAMGGAMTGQAVYVGSLKNVWMSVDDGATWTASPMDRPVLAANSGTVWTVDSTGTIRRSKAGVTEWKEAGHIADITIPFGVAIQDERVYVAAEGEGWKAIGPILEPGGKLRTFPGLVGKQALSVRIDPTGRAWIVGEGVFVLNREAGMWRKVWPEISN